MHETREILDFSVVHELVYQVKVRDAMTTDVVTISPTDTLRLAQKILRDKRISGVPVVDNGIVIGIISVEDIIRALDEKKTDSEAGDFMSKQLVTLYPEYSLIKALSTFEKYSYGRFPVVDKEKRLLGILTRGDITRQLMFELNKVAEKAAVREAQEMSTNGSVLKDGSILVDVKRRAGDYETAGILSSQVKKQLQKFRVEPEVIRRVAIALYEAETNILIHSIGGSISVWIEEGNINIMAKDAGPGIADVEQALKVGFSTASDNIRALGFGAGMGLPNMKKCADSFEIESQLGKGTTVLIEIALKFVESRALSETGEQVVAS